MGGLRRVAVGFFAIVCVLGSATVVPPAGADVADTPIVSQQIIELVVTGQRGGSRIGVASGREPIKVTKGQGGVVGLRGSTEFGGATVTVDVSPLLGFLPVHFGMVRHDLGSGAVNTPVVFGRVGSVPAGPDEQAYRLRTTWFDFSSFPWGSYSVELTVTSRFVSPASLCQSQARSVKVALEAYNARMGVYPGGAAEQMMPAGPVSEEDAEVMLDRLLEDRDAYAGPQTASIRLLHYAPPAAGRDTGVQVSIPASGSDLPFVTISMVATGLSLEAMVEGWGVLDGEVVPCADLPATEVTSPAGREAACRAQTRTVEIALEAYNARQGTYPGGADDELPPVGPMSEGDADAILARLLVDEDAQPGKPWTAMIKLLKSLPMASTLDNSGGAGQTSLPDGLTLDQFDGMFVALEYRAGEPGSDEMNVHGYYRQYDGTVNQLRQCQ